MVKWVSSMAKRKNKKVKRRLAFLGPLCLFFIGCFVFNLAYYSYRIMVLEKSKASLENELSVLRKEEDNLNNDIQKLKDPEYIAKFARENYMYSKDGEYIIKIEDNDVINDDSSDSFDYMYLIAGGSCGLLLIILYIIKKKNSD